MSERESGCNAVIFENCRTQTCSLSTFDIPVVNSWRSTTLDQPRICAGYTLEGAAKTKGTKYCGIFPPPLKSIPLPFSTYDCSIVEHNLVVEKLKGGMEKHMFEKERVKFTIQTRETKDFGN